MQGKFDAHSQSGDHGFLQVPNLKKPANEPIIMAVCNGEIDDLKKLLNNGWPNAELQEFILPYVFQLELRHFKRRILNRHEAIKFIVQKKADINHVLFSPLDFEAIKAIGEGGGNLKQHAVNGYTSLRAIVMNPFNLDWKEHIEYLLKNGVDPNKSMQYYGTVLHAVIANEGFDIHEKHHTPKYLINCLDQYHYDWNIQDSEGKTPLILAAKVRSPELVEQLTTQKSKNQSNINLDIQDQKGRTALHFSCALGDLKSTRALLSVGASFSIRDYQGKSPFDYTNLNEASVRKILEEIHIDPERDENAINNYVLQSDTYQPVKLIENGVTLNFFSRKSYWDKYGEDLIYKVQHKPYQREAGREHDLKHFRIQGNFSGKSLISACMEERKNIRSYFLAYIAKQPLTYAQLLERTKEALKNDLALQPFLGFIEANNIPRALREVCAKGKNELAAMLIAYAVSANLPIKDYINEASKNGKTSLHWAACSASETGDNSLVELLLAYKPDVTIRDKKGNLYSDYLKPELLNTVASSTATTPPSTTGLSNNAFNQEEDDWGMGCILS